MSVQNQINRINNEVSEQTALLQQITTALEGKAAGGGGGSSNAGEYIDVKALPSTYGYDDSGLTFIAKYLTIENDSLVALLVFYNGTAVMCACRSGSTTSWSSVSLGGESSFMCEDVSSTVGTNFVFCISYLSNKAGELYALPIYGRVS